MMKKARELTQAINHCLKGFCFFPYTGYLWKFLLPFVFPSSNNLFSFKYWVCSHLRKNVYIVVNANFAKKIIRKQKYVFFRIQV